MIKTMYIYIFKKESKKINLLSNFFNYLVNNYYQPHY